LARTPPVMTLSFLNRKAIANASNSSVSNTEPYTSDIVGSNDHMTDGILDVNPPRSLSQRSKQRIPLRSKSSLGSSSMMTEAHEKESPADSNDSLMHALSPVSNAPTSGAPSCNQKQLASGKADGMESFQDASDDRLLVCVAKGDFNAPVISYSGHREIKPLAPEGDEEDQTIWHEIIAKSVPHPNGQG